MLTLILLHFALAGLAPPLVRWAGRRAFFLLAMAPAAAAGWALYAWIGTEGPVAAAWRWIPDYRVVIALRLDELGTLMMLLAGGIGALVCVYCARYFEDDEPRLGAFAGTLIAFAGSMLGLVLADDLIVLYVFWELTTIFSFLLIGHRSTGRGARRSALQALLVTTVGGLAMLVGFILLGESAGTYRISELVAGPRASGGAVLPVALVLVLLGALTKSAIWPFSFWLPGAMAAPTPVSAYLHAAAMVKAGVYLVARLAPGYADVPLWRPVLMVLGSATMLLGGWRALRLYDLKLVLAHGTVSQLGFLLVLVGAGNRDTALAGTAMILAHALFKAPLFLVVGIVDHATGTRELRRLSGVGRAMPGVCAVAVLASVSMAALPPTYGFTSKEAAFQTLLDGTAVDRWALAATVVGSTLTTAYTLRFLWGAFARKPGREDTRVHAAGPLFLAAPAVLAVAGLVLGPLTRWEEPLFAGYAAAFPVSGDPYHLSFWHGVGTALALSGLAWVGGAALFWRREPLLRLQRRLAWPAAERAFGSVLLGLERLALQVTGTVQRGSLPVYLATALVVLLGGQIAVLIVDHPWPDGMAPRVWDSSAQAAVGLGVAAAAVLCVRTDRRMTAVAMAGLTGYGTAVLYVLYGAPDLALTQFSVETVSLVVFVLVLRRLPVRFDETVSRWRQAGHLPLGVATGVLTATLVWIAAAARTAAPAGPELAVETAHHGLKNVVATILVDLRAWDTLGESAVLVTAAAGVTSLIFLRVRAGPPPPPAVRRQKAGDHRVWSLSHGKFAHLRRLPSGAPEDHWLAAGKSLAPERRSVIFEVVARLTFHPMLVLSVYLLFCAENLPGGGFTAGLVAGLALVVRYLAGGRFELAEAAPVGAGFLTGLGLTVCAGTALGGLIGGTVLQSGTFHGELPPFGSFHLSSPVLFDTGVYLLVLGVVLDIVRALGGKIDRQAERGMERETERETGDQDESGEAAAGRAGAPGAAAEGRAP
ncbi:Na+/H+ antiporter subunit A [Streptomyces sp. NPDC003077]|uniref:Na+/H+ antiporter subunit A n=1 Tax=Streptomyces sp. NPDC003077 TaxID=3154443 RepID=UPI0033A03E6F